MTRVFISHAGEDAATADRIHKWLSDAGHKTFLDHHPLTGIAVGDEWQQRLHERLRWADAVVCVVTPAYIASTWCTAEVAVAQSRGSRLLPIAVETTAVHPLLRSVQHINAGADLREARAKLVEAVRRVDTVGPFGWPDSRSPFPGLRPFDTNQRQVFFGRERESVELATQLRSPAERTAGTPLIIVGPSGCGKSSLVRAGLIPMMAADEDWLTIPAFTPGADPVGALTRELAASALSIGLNWLVADVRIRLAERGLIETADELLLAVPGGRRCHLLLVVDQLEELLTHTGPNQRGQFCELLGPAMFSSVHIVGTLRPEFLDQILIDENLATWANRIFGLGPMRRDVLSRVIEGPAELAGLAIENGLTQRLIEDTGGGEALPMLAYALAELADGLERGGKLLRSRYDQLGGVQGTLTRQAETALTAAIAAGGRTRADVLGELLRLVTVDEQGRPTRWRVRRAELPDIAKVELEAFVARRLLITDTDHDGAVLGVAHEAFLTAWSPLAEAITATSIGLRARRAIEQAGADWEAEGRPYARLWERSQLAAGVSATGVRIGPSRRGLRGLAERSAGSGAPGFPAQGRTSLSGVVPGHRIELSPGALEFLRASARRARRLRARATTVLSVLLVLAVGAAVVATTEQRIAEERQQVATARSLLTEAQSALPIDPPVSVRLGEAAFRAHPSAETQAGLVSLILHSPFSSSFEAHTAAAYDVAFSSNGQVLATAGADNKVKLWDLTDPAHPHQLGNSVGQNAGAVKSLAFSPNGRILATAGEDGLVNLWDVTDPTAIRPLADPPLKHSGAVEAVAFTADGMILATSSPDGDATLWNIADPARPVRVSDFQVGTAESRPALAFDPEARTLVTSSDAESGVWILADPGHPRRVGGNLVEAADRISAVTFLPDSHILVAGSLSGVVNLWDLTDPARPHQLGEPLEGHTQIVTDVALSPDGRILATASADGTARVWNITDPAHPEFVRSMSLGVNRIVFALAFAPNGRTLATAEDGGTVTIWDLLDPALPHPTGDPLNAPGKHYSIEYITGQHDLITAGERGVYLWDVSDPTRQRPHAETVGSTAGTTHVAVSPDGQIVAATGQDGRAVLLDISDPEHARRLGALPPASVDPTGDVVFTPQATRLAIVQGGNTIVLWDIVDHARPERVGDPITGPAGVSSVAFSPDGQTVAIAGDTGVRLVSVADPAHPRQLASLTGHVGRTTDVAFGPIGHVLATAGVDRTARLWDITDPTQPRQLGDPLTGHLDTIEKLAFSADGRTLATVSDDTTVILWDLTDLVHAHPLGEPIRGHHEVFDEAAFSPDGRILATSSTDGTIIQWSLKGLDEIRADPLRRACSMTGGGLDRTEWARYDPDSSYLDSCT